MEYTQIAMFTAVAIAAFVSFLFLIKGVFKRASISAMLWMPKNTVLTTHFIRIACLAAILGSLILVIIPTPISNKKNLAETAHVLFLIDVSKSQAAERPLGTRNQLEKSKSIVKEICDEFPNIRTAIYAFTDKVRSHSYFSDFADNSHNCSYANATLDNIVFIESVTGSGSNIARSLLITSNTFPKEAESRIIILFSDGGYTNEGNEFVRSLADIRKNNIKLIVVGVGEKDGAFIPIYDNKGNVIAVEKTFGGKKIVAALNADTLRAIAKEVDGEYFDRQQTDELFSEIRENLVEQRISKETPYSAWKLAPLAIIIAGTMILAKLII